MRHSVPNMAATLDLVSVAVLFATYVMMNILVPLAASTPT